MTTRSSSVIASDSRRDACSPPKFLLGRDALRQIARHMDNLPSPSDLPSISRNLAHSFRGKSTSEIYCMALYI